MHNSILGGGGDDDNPDSKGQGHASWCGLECGEEDVDWRVDLIPGKGRGLIAIKDIPLKSRIIVDGWVKFELLANNNETSSHDKVKDKEELVMKVVGGSRCSLVNHACDANAAKCLDPEYKVGQIQINQLFHGRINCSPYFFTYRSLFYMLNEILGQEKKSQ